MIAPDRKAFLVGIGIVAALVLMAMIVNLRLGAADGLPPVLGTRPGAGSDGGGLPVLWERMPEFRGIKAWLNSPPLTAEGLKGKVVLIDFWTYSCINCIRTLPYITAWHGRYADKGLVIVGVHTPEFAFEKEEANVRAAMRQHGIAYPVALDNDYDTWDAYDNRYWPAKYLFDAQGRLRYVHFGEGEYDVTERNIQALLQEAGMEAVAGTTEVPAVQPDFSKIGTPELYIGYDRQEALGSPEAVREDEPQRYSVAPSPRRNAFYFGGTWRVEYERAVLVEAPGELVVRYSASAANLVAGGGGGVVRAEVTLDGAPIPEEFRGIDVVVEDGKTYVRIDEHRLYNVVDGRGRYGEHVLRIRFLDAGIEAYAYTFG